MPHIIIDIEVLPVPVDTVPIMCDLLRYEIMWEFKRRYNGITDEEAAERAELGNPYDKDVTSKDESGRPPTRVHIKPLWFAYKVLGDAGAVTSGGIYSQASSWLMNGVWPRQTIKTLMHCVRDDGMQFPSISAFLEQINATKVWFQWDQVMQARILHDPHTTLWAKGMQLECKLLEPHGLRVFFLDGPHQEEHCLVLGPTRATSV